jgi:hypothetical protein
MIFIASPDLNNTYGYVLCLVTLFSGSLGFGILSEVEARFEAIENTPYYKNLPLESLKISPDIRFNQFNNNPYLGIALSLNF